MYTAIAPISPPPHPATRTRGAHFTSPENRDLWLCVPRRKRRPKKGADWRRKEGGDTHQIDGPGSTLKGTAVDDAKARYQKKESIKEYEKEALRLTPTCLNHVAISRTSRASPAKAPSFLPDNVLRTKEDTVRRGDSVKGEEGEQWGRMRTQRRPTVRVEIIAVVSVTRAPRANAVRTSTKRAALLHRASGRSRKDIRCATTKACWCSGNPIVMKSALRTVRDTAQASLEQRNERKYRK
ncbi:hypothetical protein C8R45DRAFT_194583 [Mycena sanguinolenta]|nr:hypothetical protein C8R45DRAFT_194583 [Mycena sanguinolenta]